MRQKLLLLAAALAAALIVGGCGGLDKSSTQGSDSTVTTPGEHKKKEPKKEKQVVLPAPQAGQVNVEGDINSTLTGTLVNQFNGFVSGRNLSINVNATSTDVSQGIADLCAGKIDIVDAARQITKPEIKACRDNGLTVIDFQTAFDAIVLATRNERDVGADCLTVSQLRAIYQAGSTINAWNQLDPTFRPLRLTTPGPLESSTNFSLLAQDVLGEGIPSAGDVRSDYQPLSTESAIRHAVFDHPPGPMGLFGFTFYTQFEEQLRPLEIDGETGDRCVFPSTVTIQSSLYPLTRAFRLYTTDRSLARSEVQEFLRFYLQRARKLAAKQQFVPLPTQVRLDELAAIENPSQAQPARPSEKQLPTAQAVVVTGGVGQSTGSGSGSQSSAPTAAPQQRGTTTTTTTTGQTSTTTP